MHYRLTIILLLVMVLLGVPGAILAAPATSETEAPSPGIESIGWIMNFDITRKVTTEFTATLTYALRFRGSTNPIDIQGSARVTCASKSLASGARRCTVPDMATLIWNASNGKIDIRQMQIPLGTLDVCGEITRFNGSLRQTNILTTFPSSLYVLTMSSHALNLTHQQRATSVSLAPKTSRFHLTIPDTTLTAPASYTFDILLDASSLYRVDQLVVVDPGAFAHLHDQGCDRY